MKSKRLFIGIFIFTFIIVPLIVNALYKISGPSWLVSEWPSGDLLQYYGMIVTALIAIIGLYFTFQDNRKGIREQSRLDKLPYFSLTTLNYIVRNPLFQITTEKEIESKGEKILRPKDKKEEYFYREENTRAVILEIKDGKASIKTKLSEEDKSLILNGGVAKQHMGTGLIGLVNEPMTYVPIILRNVGNGPALNFIIGFNKLIDDKLVNPLYLSSTSVNNDEEFYIGLYTVHKEHNNTGEYLFEIKYRDIFNNKYLQSCKFVIKRNDNNEVITYLETEFKQNMYEHC